MASPVLFYAATPVRGQSTRRAEIAGVLGKVVGAAVMEVGGGGGGSLDIAVAGLLGGVTGAAVLANKQQAALAGLLGKITGAANLLDKDGAAIAGVLGKLTGAAAITVHQPIAIQVGKVAGSLTTYAAPIPSGAAGDLLFLYMYGGTQQADTPGASDPKWTRKFSVGATTVLHEMWECVADGSEGSTTNVVYSGSQDRTVVCIRVSHHNGLDTIVNVLPTDNNTSISTSITTAQANEMLLAIASQGGGVPSVPTFFTNIDLNDTGDPNAMEIAHQVQSASGSSGTLVFTYNIANRRGAVLIAVKQ